MAGLRADVMDGCIFCRIIAGELESSRVREDEWTLAVMDLRQTNPGHVIVLPKRHVVHLDELQPELSGPLMRATVAVAGAVRRALQPDGINIWQSNGEAAGQEVPHVHVHVFPRRSGDGPFQIYPERASDAPRSELDDLATLLRGALSLADAGPQGRPAWAAPEHGPRAVHPTIQPHGEG